MCALLRWVGSKQWIRHEIASIVHERIYNDSVYWEIFGGSASVLFTMKNIERACLCDAVAPLIRTYKAIKDDPITVWNWTQKFGKYGIESYSSLRDLFNDYLTHQKIPKSEYELAGLFIYINACCFNGLWRQNTYGEFNVPVSDRKLVKIPKQRSFINTSQILQRTDIRLIEPPSDIFGVINESKEGDVIFADPPYYGKFDGYDGLMMSSKAFHEKLSEHLYDASIRDVTIITMNSNDPFIYKLYRDWCHIELIERYQTISGTNKGRGEWKQLLAISK